MTTRSYRRHRNPQLGDNKEQPFFSKEANQPAETKAAKPSFFQKKGLTVGQPGDKYEQEADAMADAVVNNSTGAPPVQQKEISSIQRESLATPQEDEKLGTAEQRMEEDKLVQEKPEIQNMESPEEEEAQVQQQVEEEEEIPIQQQSEEEEEMLQTMHEEKEEPAVQTKESASTSAVGAGLSSTINGKSGKGRPMDKKTRAGMESKFGVDFSDVSIHTDQQAVALNKKLHAQAFTHGKDIHFNSGKYNPGTTDGKHLLAHELTHVVQQNNQVSESGKAIQRRLIVNGANNANVIEYLNLIGGAAGFTLRWLAANPRVRITGNTPAGPTSPTSRRNLRQVVNDPVQNAELFIGTHQDRVAIGAFPGAGSTVQTIDIDDIRNLNASLPGQGTAKAFHEMMENYNSHAAGGPGFGPSHQVGVEAESNALEESGIVGRRLNRSQPQTNIPDFIANLLGLATGPGISYHTSTQEFTHYFLVMVRRLTVSAAGSDFEIVSAFRVPKVQVSQRTVDSFVTGNNAIPPAGNATLNATLADLNANANATVLVEGFADNVGRSSSNRALSSRRAESARAFFIANGINANRIAVVGRGETNFVAPNNTEASRSRNRRIVMTVHRPGP